MRAEIDGRRVRARARVVVADDHPLYRAGLSRALTGSGVIEVVGEAATGPEALETITRQRPDVALLDLHMPGLDGSQVAAAVLRDGLATRVLIVSAFDDPAQVFDALEQGAAGFVHKESTPAEIINAVLACAAGRDVLTPRLAPGLAAEIRRRAERPGPALTARELEVLELIAAGDSVPAIAKRLYLSTSTVKTHVQRLCEKLGVGGQAAAVAEAMRRGLLE
jgi:two-component system nitrate/nitrite response regulator NarL